MLFFSGLYIIEFSPSSGGGGGGKSKGLDMVKGKERGKREKKKIWGKYNFW